MRRCLRVWAGAARRPESCCNSVGVKFRSHVCGIDRGPVEGSRSDVRIVRRDEVIRRVGRMEIGRQVAGTFVHIQTENSGKEVPGDRLTVVVAIALWTAVSERKIKVD